YLQYERFRDQSRLVGGVAAAAGAGRVNLGWHGTALLAAGDAVTDNFFALLGVSPQAGRFFAPGDDRPGAAVAVVSDRYWRNRLGADPAVVGAPVTVNRLSFTIVGIAPPGFTGMVVGAGPDLWIPLHALDRLAP